MRDCAAYGDVYEHGGGGVGSIVPGDQYSGDGGGEHGAGDEYGKCVVYLRSDKSASGYGSLYGADNSVAREDGEQRESVVIAAHQHDERGHHDERDS